jgi:DNA-binding NarL/FixJ family response regulator
LVWQRVDAVTKILILEDQPDGIALLGEAVRLSFSDPEITVVRSLAAAFSLSDSTFDYALIDLRLPDGLSIDWLRGFKRRHAQTVAIVTSLYDDDDLVFSALRAGADGYLLKGDGADRLASALGKAMQGEPPISPAIARKLMKQLRSTPPNADPVRGPVEYLTTREQEVLTLIGGGMMIKQVAAQLGIGYHTVNDNIKAIYRKLNIHTRAEAAAEAARRGLVP